MFHKEKFLSEIIRIQAFSINTQRPFSYASGLYGPIYCDNRLLLSYPELRSMVISGFMELIELRPKKFQSFVGMATAGIPHAAILADRYQLPMGYVRSKKKDHGTRGQLEGNLQSGDTVVLVEDLINQGSSIRQGILALKDNGVHIQYVLSIVNYEMEEAKKISQEFGIEFVSLIFWSDFIEYLEKVQNADIHSLLLWKNDPREWSLNFVRQSENS